MEKVATSINKDKFFYIINIIWKTVLLFHILHVPYNSFRSKIDYNCNVLQYYCSLILKQIMEKVATSINKDKFFYLINIIWKTVLLFHILHVPYNSFRSKIDYNCNVLQNHWSLILKLIKEISCNFFKLIFKEK